MGSLSMGLNVENRNCIKGKRKSLFIQEFRQYDSYGNNIYSLIQDESKRKKAFVVYDIDHVEIGSIDKQEDCDVVYYTFYDPDNQITKRIERFNCCSCCCSTNYNFYDADNNTEAIVVFKTHCGSAWYEVYDIYNKNIYRAEINTKCCEGKNCLIEYDQNNKQEFKIIWNLASYEKTFKIFDNNDTEVNLENKTLFNDGFTRVQVILILEMLFYENNDE